MQRDLHRPFRRRRRRLLVYCHGQFSSLTQSHFLRGGGGGEDKFSGPEIDAGCSAR